MRGSVLSDAKVVCISILKGWAGLARVFSRGARPSEDTQVGSDLVGLWAVA